MTTETTPPANPATPTEDDRKNAIKSVTLWGLITALLPLIQQVQTWSTMTPNGRTTFLLAAFGWIVTLYGRIRQGDLKFFWK